MKLITLIISFFISISLWAQEMGKGHSFELEGFVKGKKGRRKIYLFYPTNANVGFYDSAKIIGGKFCFKGFIKYPTDAIISYNNVYTLDGVNAANLYLDPCKMVIDLKADNFKTFKLTGSKSHNEYLQLKKLQANAYEKMKTIGNLIQKRYRVTNNIKDSVMLKKEQKIMDSLTKEFDQIVHEQTEIGMTYAKNYPSSFLALKELRFRFVRQEGLIYADTIIDIFNNMSNDVKSSEVGKEFSLLISNYKKSSVGSVAPAFKAIDINNNSFSLTDFRNKKYILLDFWASWCGPCREDIPFLKKMFNQYNAKEFDIIAISQDDNSLLWKNAIIKEGTEIWKNILEQNGRGIANSILNNYFVSAIPVKILINKEGIIIGRWRGGGIENKMTIEKMLNEIFN